MGDGGASPEDQWVLAPAESASLRDLERCRRRVSVEAPHELRRHPDEARMAWLASFVYLRARSLTDDLVDLLIETIHRIGARAERKVERELLDDLKRVTGKQNLLFELADATLTQPDGVVRDEVEECQHACRDLLKRGLKGHDLPAVRHIEGLNRPAVRVRSPGRHGHAGAD